MQLNPLEKRMSNIRLVPKVVLLMVFSTVLLLIKLWFDASNLETTLLSEGIAPDKADTIEPRLHGLDTITVVTWIRHHHSSDSAKSTSSLPHLFITWELEGPHSA